MGRMKMSDLVTRLRGGIHTSEDETALRKEAADRIIRLERDFARAEEEMKIADRNRIHFQKELERFMAIARDQAGHINELRSAIYHYVNLIVESEGISFLDELPGTEADKPSWAKLIEQVWDEVKKEEAEEQ
jgi:hypothetical protein